MSEDRPLTEFSASSDGSAADGDTHEESVEPVAVTYRCRPDGFVCAECGTETTTQWADDGAFVCPDCKSWA